MRRSILTFVSTYLPGYKAGGPIQSVANIVDHLGAEFAFRIVAGDRDSGDIGAYAGVIPGKWMAVGNGEVCYISPQQQTLKAIARLMQATAHDAVYINSFFNPRFSIFPLLAMHFGLAPRKPVILAPRGEFSGGALAFKSGKKRWFLAIGRLLGLHRNVVWQASSEHEERDIRSLFGSSASVCVASNLPRKARINVAHAPRMPGDSLRILFLSRISPSKNLTFLLDILSHLSMPVDCALVGSISDPDYWKECEARIAGLPPHIRVCYKGITPAPEVPGVMAQYDLLFLPTLGENFGHVIIEALSAGTPVLISDRTPWRDLEAKGAGWVYPLETPESFIAVIERLSREDTTDIIARREAALNYARHFTESDALLPANRRLFEAALARARR